MACCTFLSFLGVSLESGFPFDCTFGMGCSEYGFEESMGLVVDNSMKNFVDISW